MPQDPFYMSKQWRAARQDYLRAHPACEVPGCGNRATNVDHRKPRQFGGLNYDWSNLVAYCQSHHSSKTVQGDGGFGRARGVVKLRVKGCDVNGRPLDPNHHWNKK